MTGVYGTLVSYLAFMFIVYVSFLAMGVNLLPAGRVQRTGVAVAGGALFLAGLRIF